MKITLTSRNIDRSCLAISGGALSGLSLSKCLADNRHIVIRSVQDIMMQLFYKVIFPSIKNLIKWGEDAGVWDTRNESGTQRFSDGGRCSSQQPRRSAKGTQYTLEIWVVRAGSVFRVRGKSPVTTMQLVLCSPKSSCSIQETILSMQCRGGMWSPGYRQQLKDVTVLGNCN